MWAIQCRSKRTSIARKTQKPSHRVYGGPRLRSRQFPSSAFTCSKREGGKEEEMEIVPESVVEAGQAKLRKRPQTNKPRRRRRRK